MSLAGGCSRLPPARRRTAATSRTTVDESPDALRLTRLAVARAEEGDEDTLRPLHLRFSHNIYGYVRSIVRNDHEAEDVTQHVFAKLMTTIHKYDDRGIPFFACFCRINANAAIDHLRSRPRDSVRPRSSTPMRTVRRTSTKALTLPRAHWPSPRGPARSRDIAPCVGDVSGRDRRAHGPHRVLDPRVASPPRPTPPAAGADPIQPAPATQAAPSGRGSTVRSSRRIDSGGHRRPRPQPTNEDRGRQRFPRRRRPRRQSSWHAAPSMWWSRCSGSSCCRPCCC